MLSRVGDERVFKDSNDVVFSAGSSRLAKQQLRPNGQINQVDQIRRQHLMRPSAEMSDPGDEGLDEEDDDDDEESDDQLHPDHPYNTQLRKLARRRMDEPTSVLMAKGRPMASITRPMEFVYLPNGEIRPREECPPGIALPPPASVTQQLLEQPNALRQLEKQEHEKERRHQRADNTSQARLMQQKQMQPRQRAAHHQRRDTASSLSALSSSSSSSSSDSEELLESHRREHCSVSDQTSSEAALSSSEEEEKEEEEVDIEGSHRTRAHLVPSMARSSQQRPEKQNLPYPTESSTKSMTQSKKSGRHDDEKAISPPNPTAVQPAGRSHTPPIPNPIHTQSAGAVSPSPTNQSSPYSDVSWMKKGATKVRRGEKPSKTEARRLLGSEETTPNGIVSSDRLSKNAKNVIERLEHDLQKEKKRVLEKMTQLLEEQGKNQHLLQQLELYETQFTAKEKDVEIKLKEMVLEKDTMIRSLEEQWKASKKTLEDGLHVKDATIARLERENEQLKSKVANLKGSSKEEKSNQNREMTLKQELDEMRLNINKFFEQVEHWKRSSKETAECCDKKSEVLGVLDSMWLDFPTFPLASAKQLKENQDDNDVSPNGNGEHTNMVLFLKKRLRLREDELRQTQVKYEELKELCARQCVREADLQNFINDHRLRGNLVIRKSNDTDADDTKKNVHFQEQQWNEAMRRSTVNRGTNTPTYYEVHNIEDDNNAYMNENDDEESADDDSLIDDDDEEDYILKEPKVFVQVSRNGLYEHSPRATSAVLKKLEENRGKLRKEKEKAEVERIRLIPSSSLARRYERIPTPTSDNQEAHRKKKVSNASVTQTTNSYDFRKQIPPSGRTLGVIRKKTAPATLRTRGSTITRPRPMSARTSTLVRPWI